MTDFPKIPDGIFSDRWPDGFTFRDEANAIVAFAFRNGFIEDLHAGRQSELLVDESLSRITDAEMRALMLEASEKIEKLLTMKKESPQKYFEFVKGYNLMYCVGWKR
jgi:hypothetical protein